MAKKTHRKLKFGLWMIGAAGGVGSTVALGLAALCRRLTPAYGLVTQLPEFASLPLIAPDQIVIGGHDIRRQTPLQAVRELHEASGVIGAPVIEKCAPALRSVQANIKPGVTLGAARPIRSMADRAADETVQTPAQAVELIRSDLQSFRARHRLEHVVMVNVASSEAPLKPRAAHKSYAALEKALARRGGGVLPPSALYALGAFAADCSYVNFTPSVGMRVPAVREFARRRDVLYMGADGKTGETLLKSVLAPMFAMRHLHLDSWVGHNVLGNRDGAVLTNPAVKASKIKSKEQLIEHIVGYRPNVCTSIEFVPSLNDWKVAWDFVHFTGFLGAKMNLQFVWTGADSLLAAPLIIDLVRLTALEYTAGRRGRMGHLACFFKDPDGVRTHGLVEQWQMLRAHLSGGAGGGRQP